MVVDFQGIYMCTVRTHILNEMVPQMQIQHLKPTKCQDVSFAPRFFLQTGWWNFKHFDFHPYRTWGRWTPFWRAYFSDGLVQPPTRVVSNMFYVHPYLGKWSNFDEHIFQMGWFNHQPEKQCQKAHTTDPATQGTSPQLMNCQELRFPNDEDQGGPEEWNWKGPKGRVFPGIKYYPVIWGWEK